MADKKLIFCFYNEKLIHLLLSNCSLMNPLIFTENFYLTISIGEYLNLKSANHFVSNFISIRLFPHPATRLSNRSFNTKCTILRVNRTSAKIDIFLLFFVFIFLETKKSNLQLSGKV